MLGNRDRAPRKREAKRMSCAKKNQQQSPRGSLLSQDWLEDLEGYRTVLHRILRGKGVEYGCY